MAFLFCCRYELVNLISAEVASLFQVRHTPDLFIPHTMHDTVIGLLINKVEFGLDIHAKSQI